MNSGSAFSRLGDTSKAIVAGAVLLAMVALLLLAAEGLVRVRQYFRYGSATAFDSLYVVDETSGLRIPRPGARTDRIGINSLGFRGAEIPVRKATGAIRVAYLGASTTYCAEVTGDERVWVHLVDRELERTFPGSQLDFVNAGVPGYTVASSMRNLELRVAPLEPDIVVIYHSTNDLSGEMREIAEQQGVVRTNLAAEQSWLAQYSLLWKLVEMNVGILLAQRQATQEAARIEFAASAIGEQFRKELTALVRRARELGAKRVALVTFAVQLRKGQTQAQLREASESATYYMPFTTPEMLIAAYARYNQIIRETAATTGALLIEGEDTIPGDPEHFFDTVHFTDAGSRLQAQRVGAGLGNDPVVRQIFGR